MKHELKSLLFCEIENDDDGSAWSLYSQWIGEARRFGLRVERARRGAALITQLEEADALFLCCDDLIWPPELSTLVSKLIREGKRTFAIATYKGTHNAYASSFWADLGIEITNRGIYPLDPPKSFDHPQSLYLRGEDQSNALAQALLSGDSEQEFASANELDCSEEWSPAFELRRGNYCVYLRGKDRFDLFPETGNPFFAASRCFVGDEPTAFISTNAFMMDGFTSTGGYPTSGYREHRSMSNQLLRWLADDLSVKDSRNERIRALWFRFETLIHREVCRIMVKAFGSEWPKTDLPDSLCKKVSTERAKQSSAAPGDSHFYFVDYATIIRHHWDIFTEEWPWLADTSKSTLKKDFGSLNDKIRTPCAHPARLSDSPLSESHYDLLQRYFSFLNTAKRPSGER